MILAQVFKTPEGAMKRARFENAHCNRKYTFETVRCLNEQPDPAPFSADSLRRREYTWRIERTHRAHTP
jgi:hypothetical protein